MSKCIKYENIFNSSKQVMISQSCSLCEKKYLKQKLSVVKT